MTSQEWCVRRPSFTNESNKYNGTCSTYQKKLQKSVYNISMNQTNMLSIRRTKYCCRFEFWAERGLEVHTKHFTNVRPAKYKNMHNLAITKLVPADKTFYLRNRKFEKFQPTDACMATKHVHFTQILVRSLLEVNITSLQTSFIIINNNIKDSTQ